MSERGIRNEKVGEVISQKMEKSIVVRVYRMVKHKRYGKYLKKAHVFVAHDEERKSKIGDQVKIVETRPTSKSKRWKLKEILVVAKERGADV